MKKRIALLLAFLMTAVMLTGCMGASQPTEKDATDYVQAVLDLMCTGDYDHSVDLADVEEGKETEVRDEMIRESMEDAFGDDSVFTEEQKQKFTEFMSNAFTKANYTVNEAVKTEDGGFDVGVTIKPLKIFEDAEAKLEEKINENYATLAAMSEEELNVEVMNMMLDVLNENLENPVYADGKDLTVHYGLLDEKEKLYGVSEEDGEKLGEALFYVDENAFS